MWIFEWTLGWFKKKGDEVAIPADTPGICFRIEEKKPNFRLEAKKVHFRVGR